MPKKSTKILFGFFCVTALCDVLFWHRQTAASTEPAEASRPVVVAQASSQPPGSQVAPINQAGASSGALNSPVQPVAANTAGQEVSKSGQLLSPEEQAACVKPKTKRPTKPLLPQLAAIFALLAVILVVVKRLPKSSVEHTKEYKRRRVMNWLPLGLTYAFLYMARYNINVYMDIERITAAQFGTMFGVGSLVYGLAFFINGPLTDRWGGRATILISAGGVAITNLVWGYFEVSGSMPGSRMTTLTVLYAINMYFQSFGAVSIVKVNQAWFHLRERGTFSGIFGILISLGIFFAYDGGRLITDYLPPQWLFFTPAILLTIFFVLDYIYVFDSPQAAGLPEIATGDESDDDNSEERPRAIRLIAKVLTNPVIMTVAMIELCSGFLRQAILQWGREFGKGVGLSKSFVFDNWGVVSCIVGIIGGIFAGSISDHLFQSRRGPVCAVLYAIMLICAILIIPLFGAPALIPWVVAFMAMAIIGVHGMLSGTMSQDFGGKKSTGVVVGIIDGFVYFGSTLQAFFYGANLPGKIECPNGRLIDNVLAKDIANWRIWPYAMVPVALLGLILALRVWNARPGQKKTVP